MKRKQIGDPALKKYNRGTLATKDQPGLEDHKLFALFINKVQVKKILTALRREGRELSEHEIFDLFRKVGLCYQSHYRKTLQVTRWNRQHMIFAAFCRGRSLRQLLTDFDLAPWQLIADLRSVGSLYQQYYMQTCELPCPEGHGFLQ